MLTADDWKGTDKRQPPKTFSLLSLGTNTKAHFAFACYFGCNIFILSKHKVPFPIEVNWSRDPTHHIHLRVNAKEKKVSMTLFQYSSIQIHLRTTSWDLKSFKTIFPRLIVSIIISIAIFGYCTVWGIMEMQLLTLVSRNDKLNHRFNTDVGKVVTCSRQKNPQTAFCITCKMFYKICHKQQ